MPAGNIRKGVAMAFPGFEAEDQVDHRICNLMRQRTARKGSIDTQSMGTSNVALVSSHAAASVALGIRFHHFRTDRLADNSGWGREEDMPQH